MELEQIYSQVIEKLKTTAKNVGSNFPHAGKDGKWTYTDDITWWTNGYWPGILWQMYDITGEENFKSLASECENKLDRAFDVFTDLQHDVGFMWGDSAVASYKLTGNERSRTRALHAASLLSGRYDIKWGALRSWNGGVIGKTIIDSMMNLRLLFWATEQTGDMRFRHVAVKHADALMEYLIRPDGSAHHLCEFDSSTGKMVQYLGGQGYSADSRWSRGQSWAIHGYVRVYENTGDINYLHAAQKCADNFISDCGGKTPAWDFCDGGDFVPDTSAGACAASGMINISRHAENGEKYINAAKSILKDMYINYSSEGEMILGGATGNKPGNKNVNVSLIYGDFYFLEALRKICDKNYNNIYA